MKNVKIGEPYWVVHTIQTRCDGLADTIHTKQVMQEVYKDGVMCEQPLSERFVISSEVFKQAMEAYSWNDVLGEPNEYLEDNS